MSPGTSPLMNFWRLLLLSFSILIPTVLHAASPEAHYAVLEDPQASMNFQQVQTAAEQGKFTPVTHASLSYGFTRSAYWLQVKLNNPSSADQNWFVRQDYPLIDYLDLWQSDVNGVWRQHSTGDRRPFDMRDIQHRDFLFSIPIASQSSKTLYLRFQSDGPINISVSVSEPSSLIQRLGVEQLLFGAYYGGFLVLIIYNLIIFLAVKYREYFYYMAYVMCYGTYMSVHNGLAFQYLWPDNPWFGNQSLLILLGLSLVFGLQFSIAICRADRYVSWLRTVVNALQWVSIALLAATAFFSYQQLIFAYSIHTLVVSIAILIIGFVSLFNGSVPARYFMVAWLALLVGVIVYMLKQFGLLPHNELTQNSFQIGSLIEMVLLSLALGARVSELRKIGLSDALTSLGNRHMFDDCLPREFAAAQRHQSPLSLLVLDIDHFKQFNDKLGHAKGDEAIEAVGRLLRKHVRKPYLPCRFGGEEFVVLLPRTKEDEAEVLAERLRRKVEAIQGFSLPLTISIGIATFEQDNFSDTAELFESADQALYAAKEGGRNQVVRFSSLSVEKPVAVEMAM